MTLAVRDASAADYPTFARLFPELAVPDPLPGAEQFAAQILPHAVVAEDGGRAVGYASWRFYGPIAHVVHVITDPAARGRGVGRALMEATRTRAAAGGCTRWYLNVKRDNAAAIRLYERCGMAPESETWALRAEWPALLAMPAGAFAGEARAPEPADDERVGARFGFPAERIALSRGRPGNVLGALWEDGEPVAFGAFDPAFPGVYPIGVARVDLARPLLQALLPHARHPHVNVSVERDRALADALRAAGATLLFEVVRMGAALGA